MAQLLSDGAVPGPGARPPRWPPRSSRACAGLCRCRLGERGSGGAGGRLPATAVPPNQEESVSGSGLAAGHSDEPRPRRVRPTLDCAVRTAESGTGRFWRSLRSARRLAARCDGRCPRLAWPRRLPAQGLPGPERRPSPGPPATRPASSTAHFRPPRRLEKARSLVILEENSLIAQVIQ